jgi:succinate dehydrogenase / fumarate reductase iron-sulfur subunit
MARTVWPASRRSPISEEGSKVVIRPLPGLPVIRDLVIDMTQFYTQWEKVKPFLINDETAARA